MQLVMDDVVALDTGDDGAEPDVPTLGIAAGLPDAVVVVSTLTAEVAATDAADREAGEERISKGRRCRCGYGKNGSSSSSGGGGGKLVVIVVRRDPYV